MKAMVLHKPNSPLELEEVPKPEPDAAQLLVKVHACAICRTDLHIIDGELPSPKLPLILGHQIVGIVEAIGKNVHGFKTGDRIGIPWLGHTCGECNFCKDGRENLCDNPKFTGYDLDGGFAEYCVCYADYALHLPEGLSDEELAPLLCAGLIGYRTYRKIHKGARTLGIYGFGSAAHILTQVARAEDKAVYAFTRPGDTKGQEFARKLGATWAGGSDDKPPELLDAALIFAPVGGLIPQSLKELKKGGQCISGGIHMSDIPSFPYKDLWEERSIESVANLTRQDERDFFQMIKKIPLHVQYTTYPLEDANEALAALRKGSFNGSCVLKI